MELSSPGGEDPGNNTGVVGKSGLLKPERSCWTEEESPSLTTLKGRGHFSGGHGRGK